MIPLVAFAGLTYQDDIALRIDVPDILVRHAELLPSLVTDFRWPVDDKRKRKIGGKGSRNVLWQDVYSMVAL